MDLFAHARNEQNEHEAPLAARMRPRNLDEFIGQEHVVGPGRLLRRAIQADQLSSLIFYGPPGTGKTTLAMVIANTTSSRFVTLNAVLAGVQDIRKVTAEAREDRDLYGRRTILFVDEVHRWNKAQQDALLPWVENGTIVMIGATTENPWFSVNKALLSRSRVFQLVPLSEGDLLKIAEQAIADAERGYGKLNVIIQPDAMDHLVNVANGDARSLLNALELAVETTDPDNQGRTIISLAVAEESIQRRAVLYDREGDYHFDTISAFIKSIRGSDPDAALYWLSKMVYAGEDPRFIFRRLLISASEDIGLADPQALRVVESAAATFDRVGLPEGQFHLAEATLYLATAPKSNSTMGYFDALEVVRTERSSDVPAHLKDASRDKEGFGHGEGYLYPHAYRDHWVAQQYLPSSLQGRLFYEPGDQGYEKSIQVQVQQRREAQLAAVVDTSDAADVLTFSPVNANESHWLTRAIGSVGQELANLREIVFGQERWERHWLVLDLNAGSGLLTWEALRRVPEGGVWVLVDNESTAQALIEQSQHLTQLSRPQVWGGAIPDVTEHADVRFDRIIGRNALGSLQDKASALKAIADILAAEGALSLVEAIPSRAQRLSDLLNTSAWPQGLAGAFRELEEELYNDPTSPLTNWKADDLAAFATEAGLRLVQVTTVPLERQVLINAKTIEGWFGEGSKKGAPSLGQRLRSTLSDDQVGTIELACRTQLVGDPVPWHAEYVHLQAARGR